MTPEGNPLFSHCMPIPSLMQEIDCPGIVQHSIVDNYVHICSDTKRDRCGMYPKKTLSAASLLSECERKRRRSLEARASFLWVLPLPVPL